MEPAQTIADRFPAVDWHTLWTTTGPEPDWIVPGMIERGEVYSLYGNPGTGKSLVSQDLAASLAAGRDLFGRPTPHQGPVRVLYVDHENTGRQLIARLTDMGYGPADLDHLIYHRFPAMHPLDTPAGGAELVELVEHHDPVLVVLDTLSKVIHRDENGSEVLGAFYRYVLAPLKKAGRTVVYVDHKGHEGRRQRGSTAKGADVDGAWMLAVESKAADLVRLTLSATKQRSGDLADEIALTRYRTGPDGPLRHIRTDLATTPGRPALSSRVAEVVAALDRLDVGVDLGRQKVAEVLRAEGDAAGTETIRAAQNHRRQRLRPVLGQVSGR